MGSVVIGMRGVGGAEPRVSMESQIVNVVRAESTVRVGFNGFNLNGFIR